MKCDVPRSVCLAQEEWDLLDDVVDKGGYPSRNDTRIETLNNSWG